MRADGTVNHHNRPVLFYCPRELSHDSDKFSQFNLSFDSKSGSLGYQCFPVEITARISQWLAFSALKQTNSWQTGLTLSPNPHLSLSFVHPHGLSALATSIDRTYQLFLGPSNVSAKFFGQFDGFRANFDMDIGDITTFMTTFIRGNFSGGCHLHMHLKDVGTNRNSCFYTWENPMWAHCFRVTFPVVKLHEFSLNYGLAFRDRDRTKVRVTVALARMFQIRFALGGKFEWRDCRVRFFLGDKSIEDGFAVKGAIDWKATKDTTLSIAKMSDHYALSLRGDLQNGIVITPSFLYKEGLIGMRLGITTDDQCS
jgi:hypothetical protein